MHASKADLPAMVIGEYEGRMVDCGRLPRRVRVDAGAVPARRVAVRRPARRPLPVPALGLPDQGLVPGHLPRRPDEIVHAGEAYHLRPGHFVQTLEPVELVELSPVHQHDETMAVVARNMGVPA